MTSNTGILMADGPRESIGDSCGGKSELEGRLLDIGTGDSAAISLPAVQTVR